MTKQGKETGKIHPPPGSVSFGKAAEAVPSALTRYTRIFNFLGVPALSIPCGFSSSGLPIGLQIVSRPFAEAAVLKIAHAYEGHPS